MGSLEISLSPEESRRLTERPTDSIQAYECYLKAREEFWRWSEGGLERALQIIQNGLEILGESELLYAGLGTVYVQYIHFGIKKDESYLQKAEECIEKVFSFKPADIVKQLKLLRPIFRQTTNYGHFGKDDPDITWERTDKVAALKRATR